MAVPSQRNAGHSLEVFSTRPLAFFILSYTAGTHHARSVATIASFTVAAAAVHRKAKEIPRLS
jgi:hypothetical protein